MEINRYQKLFGVGPLGFAYGVILFVLLWLSDKALNHLEILNRPWPLRSIGLILIAIWLCWHTWCLRTIRSWWNNNRLCTTGPYRFVRHPIYSGGIFGAGIGAALMFNSWILLLWPLLTYPIWSILVRKEEKMMATVFGESYGRYAGHTGRLFPRLFK
jgi:protein-S-isoprenylcysteine O-methyltransferase Ste14